MTTSANRSRPAEVLIVDDHGLLAQSLAFALRGQSLRAVACQAIDEAAVLAAATRPPAAVVLLDLDLGGTLGSSLPLIPPLCAAGVAVLVLTGVTDRLRLAECVEAGAMGIVSKARPFDEVVADVLRAMDEGTTFAPGERAAYVADLRRLRREREAGLAPFRRLTPRERFVLQSIVDGRSADRIAQSAVVSVATVRSQIHSMLQKLGVNSQLAAVALAHRAGWEPSDA